MLINKKRGISPLIATVLLIGFTIVIVSMVFIWWGDVVKQQAIKEGLRSDAQRACMEHVKIEVKSAQETNEGLEVTINNKGSQLLRMVRFRIKTSGGEFTITKTVDMEGVSQDTILIKPSEYEGEGSVKSIKVFPVVVKSSEEGSVIATCSEKAVEYEIK